MNTKAFNHEGTSQIGERTVWEEGQTGFGRTGFGKIRPGSPKWAKATSTPFGTANNPKRPEVGRIRNSFTPIRSIKSCENFGKALAILEMTTKPHDPNSVVLPVEGARKQDPCDIKKTFKLQKSYWNLLGFKNMDVRPKA